MKCSHGNENLCIECDQCIECDHDYSKNGSFCSGCIV